MKVYQKSIEILAHAKWKKAGMPDGKSLDFWLEAENELNSFDKELLKLPICPLCHQTKCVSENCYAIPDPGFTCSECGIEWTDMGIWRLKGGSLGK